MGEGFELAMIYADIGIPGASWRAALGMLLVPALGILDLEPAWTTVVPAFAALLFAIKAIAAIGRRLLPVSATTRSHWDHRRVLASHYDSYQWRKLLWFGLGLVGAAAARMPGATVQWALGAFCIAAGAAAQLIWRRHVVSPA
jgi:hypothetical protein